MKIIYWRSCFCEIKIEMNTMYRKIKERIQPRNKAYDQMFLCTSNDLFKDDRIDPGVIICC